MNMSQYAGQSKERRQCFRSSLILGRVFNSRISKNRQIYAKVKCVSFEQEEAKGVQARCV